MSEATNPSQARVAAVVTQLQEAICARVAALDATARFDIDDWTSAGDAGSIRGRGSTRVVSGEGVFEKGGVNASIVTGSALPPSVVTQRPELARHGFFAAGVSVVLHPRNPNAPAAHCNFRYFEAVAPGDSAAAAWWFGGGADLTPYYPELDDVRAFHGALRAACDRHDPAYYAAFKRWCDRYFVLKHRGEARGVGGIFYDYLDANGFGESNERTHFSAPRSFDEHLAFMYDAGRAFSEAYFPIVENRAMQPFGETERAFQLLRRGRYVEFNLMYDRGTIFGLQSGGRVESILMSLPPLVRWSYDERPQSGSREAALQAYLQPRDWFAEDPFRHE